MLLELSYSVPESVAEELSDALMDEGAFSVCVEDADAESEAEVPLYGEPGLEPTVMAWKNSRLKVLVDEKFDRRVVEKIASELKIEPPSLESETPVPDTDWVRVTQAQFQPTKVSDRLWIVPSWHEPPNPQAINIRLDPGVAFGTGSHPTTHLCLQWLDSHCSQEASVLDYGCGTGILAIAAAKVGARRVCGTDIDPQAIESAQWNAQENKIEANFVLPDNLKDEKFDIVIANILANPLKLLAPALIGRLKTNGTLVLSGILTAQAQDVVDAYQSIEPDLEMNVWQQKDGWVCIVGKRR